MENKILAIVVTYFPERELLEKNISAFIDNVDKLLFWENTPEDKKQQYRYIDNPKIEYCGDGINSISHALNYAWKYAESNGYDYLLTMDQDSVFENFDDYLKCTVYNENAPLGIWTPSLLTESNYDIDKPSHEVVELRLTITSGMLQSVSCISIVGGWNEALTVDALDCEYCFQAQRHGIKIFQLPHVRLIHQYGTAREVSLLGRSMVLRNYSPKRYYTIYRNHILVMRMFPEQRFFKDFFISHRLVIIKWIVIFEEEGLKKLFYILKAILSGYTSKLPIRSGTT